MNVPFVDLKRQYLSIKKDIDSAYRKIMARGEFIFGEDLAGFEGEFAKYLGVKYCLGVDSGTTALELAVLSLDIQKGDEIIIPANTFIATALAVSLAGAKPVLVDCEENTQNINAHKIEEKITKRTKAIIPVHLYGRPVDMDPILALAKKYSLYIIEDAAQAHGAKYKDRNVGTMGDIGCFSFYPSKNLGAYGDAGAVVTNNKIVAGKLQLLRNYGMKVKYHHLTKAGNHRLDNLQAAFLRVKLKHLDNWNMKRRELAKKYIYLLKNSIKLTEEKHGLYEVYHIFVVRSQKRDKLQRFLLEQGIQTLVHYPIPIHLQPAFKELELHTGSFPFAEKFSKSVLSIPFFPELTEREIEFVSDKIIQFQKNNE